MRVTVKTLLVVSGHMRSDSVMLLVYDGMRIISGAPVLYYRSLGTAPTMLGRGLYSG
jgi:hypothetical protein